MANFAKYTNAQLENLINQVYGGSIDPGRLPVDLYSVVLDRLTRGMWRGFGGSSFDFTDGSSEKILAQYYENNIGVFSGAKTHQTIVDMSSAVYDEKGFKRSFSEFKKLVKGTTENEGIFDKHMTRHLKTEFDTSVAAAQSGRQWLEIVEDSDIFPYLRYNAVNDERTRESHAVFDGVVRAASDSFWNTHMPPNGFNCRCTVDQVEEEEGQKNETPKDQIKGLPDPDDKLFAYNPGKSGYIFDEKKHPTFKVADRYKVQEENNFGLPTPPKPTEPVPSAKPLKPPK
jgi:SPP1 gp7 family putative phage head morphogenesis protein